MTLTEYQQQALLTATYPQHLASTYLMLGLRGEAGEVCDKIKKLIRDKGFDPTMPDSASNISKEQAFDVILELGDVLWYIANIYHVSDDLDITDIDRDYDNGIEIEDNIANLAVTLANQVSTLLHPVSTLITIAQIAQSLGYTFSQVCENNIAKLADRQARNVLGGSGDKR